MSRLKSTTSPAAARAAEARIAIPIRSNRQQVSRCIPSSSTRLTNRSKALTVLQILNKRTVNPQ